MSLGDFNLDTKSSKNITNPEGVGLGAGGIEIQHPTPPISTFMVSVKEASVHQSDVQKTFTGPFAGTGGGGGISTNAEDNHGFSTPTGNKVHINGAAGAESIEIVHHTGASIMIDADGSIFLQPTSRKGFGLSAGQGDGVIAAAQRIVIKGNSGITLETEGNMEFNVGGHLYMDVGGDYVLNVDGATTFSSDGTINFEATKDLVETIGGIKRTTIAGDLRTQVVGQTRFDTGKTFEVRANDDMKLNSQRAIDIQAKEASAFEVDTGSLNLLAKDDLHLSSQKSIYTVSKEDTTLESNQNVAFRTKGNAIISSPGSLHFDVSGNIDMRSNNMSLSAANNFIIYGDEFTLNAANCYHLKADQAGYIDADSALIITTLSTNISSLNDVYLRTIRYHTYPPMVSLTDAAEPAYDTATPAYPLPIEITDPRATPTIMSPKAAEFPDANTILNTMTTEVEAPDFPLNAKKMNAEEMSRYDNEGGNPNPRAKARAQPNQGAGSPTTMGTSAGTISEPGNTNYDGSNNKSVGEKNPMPIPSSIQNANDKLSRIVTVGMLPGLMRCGATNNGLTRAEILNNAAHLSYNVIDPILKQFGNRIKITDHLRIGSGGSRHYSGKAVDMASAARNFAETAEAAAWVRDNVAFDRLFLEANHAGTVHMHIEAAPAGSAGARTIWTCADPHCNSRKDGLELAFAVQGLKKMGLA
jgi:uncharacterized protein (DUF2345 family)